MNVDELQIGNPGGFWRLVEGKSRDAILEVVWQVDGASQDREALGIIQHLANALVEDGQGRAIWKQPPNGWIFEKEVDAQVNEDNHSISYVQTYVLGSKLRVLSYGRDGHQFYSRGLYTHHKESLLKVRWVYPQYRELRPWQI